MIKKRISYTLFPALLMILVALIPLMGILSEIINLTSLLFFIIEIIYIIALFLSIIINAILVINLIRLIASNKEISIVKRIFLIILLIIFSIVVVPYFYDKYVLNKDFKIISLLLYFISIVFLTFVFAFGFNTKIKMTKGKEDFEKKQAKQRIKINENNNLFNFEFKIGYEKSNVGEYDLYVKNKDKNVIFSEFTYDISLYEQKTLEEYLLKGVQDIESSKKDAKIYKEKELKEFDDKKVYTIIYEGKSEKSSPCIYRISTIQLNNAPNYILYTVTITLKEDYEKLAKEIDEIVNSARIIQNY